jgi:uncharacterized protein (DUF58 family)
VDTHARPAIGTAVVVATTVVVAVVIVAAAIVVATHIIPSAIVIPVPIVIGGTSISDGQGVVVTQVCRDHTPRGRRRQGFDNAGGQDGHGRQAQSEKCKRLHQSRIVPLRRQDLKFSSIQFPNLFRLN